MLLLLAVSSAAYAQDEEGDANATTTSAIFLLEGGATPGQAASISIGMRRGLRDVQGVRFVHPVDALSEVAMTDDLQMSIDELEPIADMVRTGDPSAAADQIDQVVANFERNLVLVPRAQLVDAYMLAAVARCRMGQRRECEARIRDIIAFREGLTYDTARYPADVEEVFQRVRARALSGGRGALVVETEPAGAEIYIDGQSYGPSPITAEGLLEGSHYITIKAIGYEKAIERAQVRAGRTERVSYTLSPNERWQIVLAPEAQRVLRGELGEPQAGERVRTIGNRLGASQLIVGIVRPAAGGQVHVQVYLYHMLTRLLQAQREATLTIDEAGMEAARQLTVDLYSGVDLSGTIQVIEEDSGIRRQPELYEQWWFWTC
ncbi:MAG: PEGA domain-containing protein, partial [Sandaracinaceae bacterium]|nr:PEGA domain-containing protein [Sandaracinaceae bacterium]